MATHVTDKDAGTAKPATSSTRTRSASSRPSNGRAGSRRSAIAGNPVALGAAAAAAGVLAGIAASMGRKVAVQGLAAMNGDWFDALKAEHKATLALFDKLETTSSADKSKRTTLLAQIKHALGKHALEEENVIYPALRDAGDKEQADRLNHEHGYVKQYLYDLENMPRDDSRWLPKASELRRDLEKHMMEEEQHLFPALKAGLAPEENARLTHAMNKEGFKLA